MNPETILPNGRRNWPSPAPAPTPAASAIVSLLGIVIAPFVSRGRFSPRLFMAWQAFYFTCFLTWKVVEALINPKGASIALIQNASLIVQLIFGFVGLVISLLGMGTYQKVKLGDNAPGRGENEAEGNGKP